ncbi:MAG: Cell wall assembly regulator [Phylliscum demangeonii]|nr:MAG: Cell wall assembly regulator [Phylliscum demangeonii]
MTSYDRHASHDSPYRTGQHMPLNTSRHAPLTSIATSGVESRADLTELDDGELKSPALLRDGYPGSPGSLPSPTSPYAPGMRSNAAASSAPPTRPGTGSDDIADAVAPGEIQLQHFPQGLPPPPPVSHSWRRIDRWAEEEYTELYDQLSAGATTNDLNELEHLLDCSLPLEVRDSLQIHDGQERGGRPTGIIFGCMLLDCEEMVQEWQQWRDVTEHYLVEKAVWPSTPAPAARPVASSSSSSSAHAPPAAPPTHAPRPPTNANPLWRQQLQARQDAQPPNAVAKAYAHPGWIPLARDWGGNNIAVDLAPGPTGTWGQVILFGRDFDCKYVVARSWAAFLAMVADDLAGDKWAVDEETQELRLREFTQHGAEPAYLDILRFRIDQKYGPRPSRRRPADGGAPHHLHVPAHVPAHGKAPAAASSSPYHGSSPVAAEAERGRAPHRFGLGQVPSSGSRPRPARSSPLAQVSEEPAPAAGPALTTAEGGMTAATGSAPTEGTTPKVRPPRPHLLPLLQGSHDGTADIVDQRPDKLVEAPTPVTRFPGEVSTPVEAVLDQAPAEAEAEAEAHGGEVGTKATLAAVDVVDVGHAATPAAETETETGTGTETKTPDGMKTVEL